MKGDFKWCYPKLDNGRLVYDADTFDYLVNDDDWVFNNHAEIESDYCKSHLDDYEESDDGGTIYVPAPKWMTRK